MLQLCFVAPAETSLSNHRRLLFQLQVLPLNGAVLETEWTTVQLPIRVGLYPTSAVVGNTIQVITYDQEQDNLPKMLVSVQSCFAHGSVACMKVNLLTFLQIDSLW